MASRRPSPVRLLCLSGPSLHLLGRREPDIYGTETLDAIHQRVAERARSLGASVDCRQSNHEGTLIDWIGEASGAFEGILLNAGAYSHTSLALADALRAVRLPAVEVHLSNPEAREPFRRRSRIAAACVGKIVGFGGDSYVLAVEALVAHLRRAGLGA